MSTHQSTKNSMMRGLNSNHTINLDNGVAHIGVEGGPSVTISDSDSGGVNVFSQDPLGPVKVEPGKTLSADPNTRAGMALSGMEGLQVVALSPRL